MFGFLKHSGFYFAIIFVATIVSFNGTFDYEKANKTAVSKFTIHDIDISEAQNLLIRDVKVSLPIQSPIPLEPSLGSPSLAFLNTDGLQNNFTVNQITTAAFAFGQGNFFILLDTIILPANPGPSNNGGSAGWAMFLDLIAGSRDIFVTQMKTGSTAAASSSFSVEVFTRTGTALGGPVGSGPGSSTAGWTSIGTVPVVQGSTSSGISEVFTLPTITVTSGDTVGVAIKFNVAGPRYFGTGSPPLSNYSDTNLTLITGEGRSAPFTPTGSWFSSRALTGEIRYVVSGTTGINNISTEIPDNYNLSQNYPNPFNPSTTIEFAIAEKNNVTLKVYNTQGKEIATLVKGEISAGTYSVHWNASNLASGIYLYSLQAGSFSQTKKLILIK